MEKGVSTLIGEDGAEASETRALDLEVKLLRNRLSIMFPMIF